MVQCSLLKAATNVHACQKQIVNVTEDSTK